MFSASDFKLVYDFKSAAVIGTGFVDNSSSNRSSFIRGTILSFLDTFCSSSTLAVVVAVAPASSLSPFFSPSITMASLSSAPAGAFSAASPSASFSSSSSRSSFSVSPSSPPSTSSSSSDRSSSSMTSPTVNSSPFILAFKTVKSTCHFLASAIFADNLRVSAISLPPQTNSSPATAKLCKSAISGIGAFSKACLTFFTQALALVILALPQATGLKSALICFRCSAEVDFSTVETSFSISSNVLR
mmetsp:Transcript_8265/g.26393  ORF Transcript_8265/g.26393 Transcript_8265/m.26393 type:complete len:245 (+) Transcript_8265:3209-3943(+)